jgi:hypothetical protein
MVLIADAMSHHETFKIANELKNRLAEYGKIG